MNSQFKLSISSDGARMTMIYDDAHAAIMEEGNAEVRRASHVEPNPVGAGWIADMAPVGGGVLGPFRLRQEALAAEVEYLKQLLF